MQCCLPKMLRVDGRALRLLVGTSQFLMIPSCRKRGVVYGVNFNTLQSSSFDGNMSRATIVPENPSTAGSTASPVLREGRVASRLRRTSAEITREENRSLRTVQHDNILRQRLRRRHIRQIGLRPTAEILRILQRINSRLDVFAFLSALSILCEQNPYVAESLR